MTTVLRISVYCAREMLFLLSVKLFIYMVWWVIWQYEVMRVIMIMNWNHCRALTKRVFILPLPDTHGLKHMCAIRTPTVSGVKVT